MEKRVVQYGEHSSSAAEWLVKNGCSRPFTREVYLAIESLVETKDERVRVLPCKSGRDILIYGS
eukprot:10670849-Prorocentrum_lima.AAC.1